MEPKGSQREPKGAKCLPKTPLAEPKSDQNASTNRSSEKVTKMIEKRSPVLEFLGVILGAKIDKNHKQIDAKFDAEKASKNDAKMT